MLDFTIRITQFDQSIRKRGRDLVIDHLSIEYEVIGCPVNQFEKQGLKRSGSGGLGRGLGRVRETEHLSLVHS